MEDPELDATAVASVDAGGEGRWRTRRGFLSWGLAAGAVVIAGGAAGLELVSHGVLPGGQLLDAIDGACSVATAPETFGRPGPSEIGGFYSKARNRKIAYTLAYPPGHRRGDHLPLAVYLHPWGGDHSSRYGGLTAARALALKPGGAGLTPMAMVVPDGGNGYWHAQPGDDPMAMIVNELIPMCQQVGLGTVPGTIVTTGISMGGYGCILLGELHPDLFGAVASISPAIWASWQQAHAANPTAYSSPGNFSEYDAVTHTASLAGKPVRVASGIDDPFHLGVVALQRALARSASVQISKGCHTAAFFGQQAPPSLSFLSSYLAR